MIYNTPTSTRIKYTYINSEINRQSILIYRLSQWVKFTGDVNLVKLSIMSLHNTRFICPLHFEDNMFWSSDHDRLQKWAVPTRLGPTVQLSDDLLSDVPWYQPVAGVWPTGM